MILIVWVFGLCNFSFSEFKRWYFKVIQNQSIENLKSKIVANDETVIQIDNLLNDFAKTSSSNQKSDKLVYYNENTQLNDIIKTKQDLINDQGRNRLELISFDKTIKDINSTLNIKNTKSIFGKLKFILPVLFIILFGLINFFKTFYNKQLAKQKLTQS